MESLIMSKNFTAEYEVTNLVLDYQKEPLGGEVWRGK